jgi:hypothetical protein
MRDLKDRIRGRIHRDGRGTVYVSKDFLDFGNRAAVDQALSRLVKAGMLRRLDRGLFSYPRVNPKLGGELAPDPELVAAAIARRRATRIVPSGAAAANALGLSTQVPGRRVYLTDSGSGVFKLGKQTLRFKQVSPKTLGPEDKTASTVVLALQHLGKDGLTDDVIARIRSTLTPGQMRKLLKESRYSVGWIADAVKKLVDE